MMQEEESDKVIKLVQSSTRVLMTSFRSKAEELYKCSDDIKKIIRKGYDIKIAREAAKKLFGDNKGISFLAIDGTESHDQQLDMLVFYAGAFGYIGQLDFGDNGCCYEEPSQIKETANLSIAIPIHEEDASSVVGKLTEGGVEVDTERLPTTLMQFAEYYMAVKNLKDNPEIKVVLLDRMPSIDAPHLIGNAIEFLESNACILQGMDTQFGRVSSTDLELARMLHPNERLKIPAPRSQLIKYAAINYLINKTDNISNKKMVYEDLLYKIGAKKERLDKLVNDLAKFNEKYPLSADTRNKEDDNKTYVRNTKHSNKSIPVLNSTIKEYWDRVLSASMKLAEHVFNTPDNEHPLLYEKQSGIKKWITYTKIAYTRI